MAKANYSKFVAANAKRLPPKDPKKPKFKNGVPTSRPMQAFTGVDGKRHKAPVGSGPLNPIRIETSGTGKRFGDPAENRSKRSRGPSSRGAGPGRLV